MNNLYETDDKISESIDKLFNHVCKKHNKVFVVRFDVHYPENYIAVNGNQNISKMIAKFIQHYEREGIDVYYIWVREQLNSKHPHYHCAVFLDGNKTMNMYHVFASASQYWLSTIISDNNGLIDYCLKSYDGTPHKNGILLTRSSPDYKHNCMLVESQLNYLKKSYGKCSWNDGMRNFGMSRIR